MEKNGLVKYFVLKALQPFFWIFTRVFKKQQNLFAFFIEKPAIPAMLFPWIKLSGDGKLTFNDEWAHHKYRKEPPPQR
jgi:hypothetical protein